jgi:hypothetical protein
MLELPSVVEELAGGGRVKRGEAATSHAQVAITARVRNAFISNKLDLTRVVSGLELVWSWSWLASEVKTSGIFHSLYTPQGRMVWVCCPVEGQVRNHSVCLGPW